ncbi:hypothetical protein GC093_12455 [Paenibacillus sp. LMG 31456]|uniref:Sensory rhodopsin transducer n=1 Tax=Paenibacillus foliorum TaxID=2654974 RepID=A0A972GNN7_9BACL|nr:sensory rhodopsin transducer [Paenibacillus foliorum]NOU94024.1 hypothetical protein [Paenibacillus foliorum]
MSSIQKGHRFWYIPDGYIPRESLGKVESHEAICLLNCYEEEASIVITVYFEDREPLEQIEARLEGRRTKHIRTSELQKDGERIPKGVPYAIEVVSSVPVILQYTRVDSTQPANALMSVIGFPLS